MVHYRCYFLGADGRILVAEDIVSATAEEALSTARRLFAEAPHFSGFELWQGAQQLHKETRELTSPPRD